MACSVCGVLCGVYDHRPRRWRHLDTCQLQTVIEASVPRVSCPEHGVLQVRVPWAEEGSGFTALFECMVISWLQAANISAVSALVGLSWDEVDGIQQRAVDRGLSRRQTQPVAHVAIDETSFQKRHEYMSVITDRERGVVLEVLEDRTKEHISSWLILQGTAQLSAIKSVSMDMWPAFINSFLEHVPEAKEKICFDRYHIASYFGNAVRVIFLLPFMLRDCAVAVDHWRRQWKYALVVATISPVAYVLVLYAMQVAPLSHVAPAREVSMLFAALIGGQLLGEGDRLPRIAGAACIAFGVMALALG